MLTQRLLDILRSFNSPNNEDVVLDCELIPQDVDFLERNGLQVKVVKETSISVFCRLSRSRQLKTRSNDLAADSKSTIRQYLITLGFNHDEISHMLVEPHYSLIKREYEQMHGRDKKMHSTEHNWRF